MANKSLMERGANLAYHARAIANIVKAFIRGGWAVAALEAVKHYWPYILLVAVILLLLPLIIFCCLPMVLFGFPSSGDAEIAGITEQATLVTGYYDTYEVYYDERVKELINSAIPGADVTEIYTTSFSLLNADGVLYRVILPDPLIQKNWLIAIHSVSIKNDVCATNEQGIREFIANSVTYTFSSYYDEEMDLNYPNALFINYLSPEEVMDARGYDEEQRNWAKLMYETLENNPNS